MDFLLEMLILVIIYIGGFGIELHYGSVIRLHRFK